MTHRLLHHPREQWIFDAVHMTDEGFDALPWDRVYADLTAVESGERVNTSDDRQVGHFWLRAPQLAPTMGQAGDIGEVRDDVVAFASDALTGKVTADSGEPFTDVLHIGIGGSALGAGLLVDALRQPNKGLNVHFLDTTDPDGIARILSDIGPRLRTTLAVVVTKSGSTPETMTAMKLAIEAYAARGIDPIPRLVAITGPDSSLHNRATAEGWRRIFPLWDWVGGRFSVTSVVSLLPAALAGADVVALLAGARDMDAWTRVDTPRDNPAAIAAGSWFLAGGGRGERNMVVIPYSDRFCQLARYLQQLVMESIGKSTDRDGRVVDQGLTVYGNKGSTDQHAYVQQLRDGPDDFFTYFIQVLDDGQGSTTEVAPGVNAGDYLQGFLLGTRRALLDRGRQSMTLTVPSANAYVLGGIIGLFERSVCMYGSLLNVNAYDQPGVEAGKKAANAVLELSRTARKRLQGGVTAQELADSEGVEWAEALYVLERLACTARATRQGGLMNGRYSQP